MLEVEEFHDFGSDICIAGTREVHAVDAIEPAPINGFSKMERQ